MSQSIKSQLSANDYQLIEANRLGTPLGVYRLKSGYFYFLQVGGLIIFLIGSAALVLLFIGLIVSPHLEYVVPPLLAGLSGIIIGGFILLVLVPQEQSAHIIVGEYGLLQIKKKMRGIHVEVVFWETMRLKDIPTARNAFTDQSYAIKYGENKKLTLSSAYQDLDELVELIVQQSGRNKT
jgi:hypothetical protein